MIVVGLTGGIGSGKTTVANFFKALGVPIYIADDAAKNLMESSSKIRKEIIELLGKEAYTETLPNRKWIAKQVFANEALLNKLNKIIHPRVKTHFKNWAEKQQANYVLYEAAILFEKGGYKDTDYNILVVAPKEERIKRLQKRDNSSKEDIEARMQNQWDDQKKIKLADFIIENIHKADTKTQVTQLHKTLSGIANA